MDKLGYMRTCGKCKGIDLGKGIIHDKDCPNSREKIAKHVEKLEADIRNLKSRKYAPDPAMDAIERLCNRRDELIQTLIIVRSRINPHHCTDCENTIALIDRVINKDSR